MSPKDAPGENSPKDPPKGPPDDKGPKPTTIVVNARSVTWEEKQISYDPLLNLAFPTPPTGEASVVTVAYRRGHGEKPAGMLAPGESVMVKDGMIFDVTATTRS